MATLLAALTAVGCSTGGGFGPAEGAEVDSGVAASDTVEIRAPRLRQVETWAFTIGDTALGADPVERLGAFDLVVLDGEEATAEDVAALQATGTIVLAYLSVGTIEEYRSWYPKVEDFRLEPMEDWGEWYADVGQTGYRSVMTSEVAPAILDKGFDGLFLDNTDMVEVHPERRAGMRTLATDLASLVHDRGGLLFTQNGETTMGPLRALYDGWNREDVSYTYDFESDEYVRQPDEDISVAQDALRSMRRAGLLVLSTDYTAEGGGPEEAEAVELAKAAGALPYVSDIELDRIPEAPLR